MIYKTDVTSPALQFGKEREVVAIAKFSENLIPMCHLLGLVDLTHGFLGASPDSTYAAESVHHKEGKTTLKRNHNYFYQVCHIHKRKEKYNTLQISDSGTVKYNQQKVLYVCSLYRRCISSKCGTN